MTGFMGMNMAGGAMGGGFNAAQNFYNVGMQQQQQMAERQAAQQAAQQKAQAAAPADGWTCSCGATVTGKFCPECGSKKPEPKPADTWTCACGAVNKGKFCFECGAKKPEVVGWTCACGAVNKGKFCPECGAKKPAKAPLYRCDKCGWEPADPHHPPKFCAECGDRFDDNDIQ
jgi:membrane protease subunit (stomatin/prohibitin family)